MKKIFGLVAVFFLGVASQAHASIYLEPYVGYLIGKMDRGANKYDVRGFGYGGRIGYSDFGLAGGFEYSTGMEKDNATPNNDITPTDMGIFVAYKLPVLLRVYAAYMFSTEAKVGSGTTVTYTGTGMKFGLGFTTFPLVFLNLDYITNSYDKSSAGTLSNNIDFTGFLFNVSLPLEF